MSSQNAFPGPNTGRPVARPTNPERPRQPSWVHPQAQAAQPPQQANGWQQQPAQPQQGGFAQQGYGAPTPNAQADYGHWGELQTGGHAPGGAAGHADPYAPQFEPYVPTRPAYGHQQPAPAYGAQQSPQWSQRGADPRSDPRGFDAGAPIAPGHAGPQAMQQFAHGAGSFERPYQEPDLGHGDWPPQQEIGGFGQDPYSQQGGAELGFAQPENGELDPAYGEEDADYEDDYAPRGRRPLMIAAALIGAVLIGGGMAYGYKKLAVSGGSQGEPPVIKSEAAPSKTKPADAGGKQFPYSDTKIMGRLGDGTSPAAAAEAPASASAAADAPSADSAS